MQVTGSGPLARVGWTACTEAVADDASRADRLPPRRTPPNPLGFRRSSIPPNARDFLFFEEKKGARVGVGEEQQEIRQKSRAAPGYKSRPTPRSLTSSPPRALHRAT